MIQQTKHKGRVVRTTITVPVDVVAATKMKKSEVWTINVVSKDKVVLERLMR